MAAFIDHQRSATALAVTITREIHISSEMHERKGSLADLMAPGAIQIEKQKHNRWKANPHPDNIILPRRAPPKKKQPQKNTELDPVDLTLRLNEHLRQLKIRENGSLTPELREMDWDKLRRQPRIDHSRVGSRLEMRRERQPNSEPERLDFYTGPKMSPSLPKPEADVVEAYRQFSPRTESASTGLYQHSQFRGTPLRKDSGATGTDTHAESVESFETSRTSSRGTGAVDRVKSFQGLPPLLFQVQSDELFNTETTLSLESTFEKLELAMTNTSHTSDTSVSANSFAGTFGRDTFGGKNSDAPPVFYTTIWEGDQQQRKNKKMSTMTTSTNNASNRTTRTDSSGETIQFVMRQSAFPQDQPHLAELPELSQKNVHPLHRLPTAASEQDFPSLPPQQQSLPILTLNEAPSQQPPFQPSPLKDRAPHANFRPSSSSDQDRGRTLQPTFLETRRSVSSSDKTERSSTHKPIKNEVSYTYWRQSRPESWGPGDDQHHDDHIDEYYLMDENKAAATSHMRQQSDAPRNLSSATIPMAKQPQGAPIKRVFGVFSVFGGGVKTASKAPTEKPLRKIHELPKAITTLEDEKHYDLPGVLPDDFPMQRKNFLGAFSSKK